MDNFRWSLDHSDLAYEYNPAAIAPLLRPPLNFRPPEKLLLRITFPGKALYPERGVRSAFLGQPRPPTPINEHG